MTALNVFFLHCTNVQATASPAIQATASPAIQSSGSRGYLFRQHYLPQLLCDEVTKKGMEQVSPCLYCILSTGAGGGGGVKIKKKTTKWSLPIYLQGSLTPRFALLKVSLIFQSHNQI